jgi:hypothetical protein
MRKTFKSPMEVMDDSEQREAFGSITGGKPTGKLASPLPVIVTADPEARPQRARQVADRLDRRDPFAPMQLMHTSRESGSTSDNPPGPGMVRGIEGKMDGATRTPVNKTGQPVPQPVKGLWLQKGERVPAGTVRAERKRNAAGHEGGLVHHEVHYPASHAGGLVHEPPGSTKNMGMVGMPAAHMGGQSSSQAGTGTDTPPSSMGS